MHAITRSRLTMGWCEQWLHTWIAKDSRREGFKYCGLWIGFPKYHTLFHFIRLMMLFILLVCSLKKFSDCMEYQGLSYQIDMPNSWTIFGRLWKKLGTRLLFITFCHSQTDGQTEVLNQTLSSLEQLLTKIWRIGMILLAFVVFTYDKSVHSTTNYSPFKVVYGFHATWSSTHHCHQKSVWIVRRMK